MVRSTIFESPIGHIEISRSDHGLTSCKIVDKIPEKTDDKFLLDVQNQLLDYFSGHRKSFDVKVDYSVFSSFSTEVYRLLELIPYGKVRTYLDIATFLDKPTASRAVGRINGANPIAFIIPCHRVIGSNGELTGYAYGIEKKRWLLNLENSDNIHYQIEMFNSISVEK